MLRSLFTAAALAALTVAAAAATPPMPLPKPEDEAAFWGFTRSFRAEALAAGISAATYDRAFAGIAINARVKELNESQPEFTRQIWEYLDGAVSGSRIANGEDQLAEHGRALARAAERYGVDREVIVAIWGLESGFGAGMGTFNAIEALATLAYAGPRAAFGREQLIAALKLIEEKNIAPADMLSSWAGAMGHTQFIPTTYLEHAIDGDGDGRRDLWRSLPDVFASTANYLRELGWRQGEPWGAEVRLPQGFDYSTADLALPATVGLWERAGVTMLDGSRLARGLGVAPDTKAAVIVPGGHKGPAFIVLPNFDVILGYNRATSYALAVSLLSDAFKGRPGVQGAWPRNEQALALDERIELQTLLAARGLDVGDTIDGVIGIKTRGAIRAYQQERGLVADGFATLSLLQDIRRNRSGG